MDEEIKKKGIGNKKIKVLDDQKLHQLVNETKGKIEKVKTEEEADKVVRTFETKKKMCVATVMLATMVRIFLHYNKTVHDMDREWSRATKEFEYDLNTIHNSPRSWDDKENDITSAKIKYENKLNHIDSEKDFAIRMELTALGAGALSALRLRALSKVYTIAGNEVKNKAMEAKQEVNAEIQNANDAKESVQETLDASDEMISKAESQLHHKDRRDLREKMQTYVN
jgi:hypothetical protein